MKPPPSIWHSARNTPELTLPAVGSAVVNEKLALAEVLGFDGLAVIDAVGLVWSTV